MIHQILMFAAKYIGVGVAIDVLFQIGYARIMGSRLGSGRKPWFTHVVVILLWPAAIIALVSGMTGRAKR